MMVILRVENLPMQPALQQVPLLLKITFCCKSLSPSRVQPTGVIKSPLSLADLNPVFLQRFVADVNALRTLQPRASQSSQSRGLTYTGLLKCLLSTTPVITCG
ncbi:hypothetical protein PHET_06499 [Paragonimus heterotremus]|uniref:Uncharacterized protein n=1 Tax=Paragonimus heterotremus TaxID=100268 RepID=A0A8J4SYN1_9TREM|nr:hypothetical protein PHET_06499 [Paragonimus heterotremus]